MLLLVQYSTEIFLFILLLSIVSVIKLLEEFCQNFVIMVGLVDGHKVASLSNILAIEEKPTEKQLLEVFLNKEDIEKIIKTPVGFIKKTPLKF